MRKFHVNVNGTSYEVEVEEIAAGAAPAAAPVQAAAPAAAATVAAGATSVTAPMPGNILDIKVKVGDTVDANTVVIMLEAMKMENEIMAPVDCRIASVKVQKGASVNSGDVLIEYV